MHQSSYTNKSDNAVSNYDNDDNVNKDHNDNDNDVNNNNNNDDDMNMNNNNNDNQAIIENSAKDDNNTCNSTTRTKSKQ